MIKKILLPLFLICTLLAKPETGRAGGFVKPNLEFLTYLNNNRQYRLDYLFGFAVGYEKPTFNVSLNLNYLWFRQAFFLTTATDYQWIVGDVAKFSLGGEIGLQYPIERHCPTCQVSFLFAPRFAIDFKIGEASWLGINTKFYFPTSQINNPYYGVGINSVIGF